MKFIEILEQISTVGATPTTPTVSGNLGVMQDPRMQAAQASQMAELQKQKEEQKKQIQDQIQQTQDTLKDLQQKLSDLNRTS